jgi:hypothetical protein
MPQWMDRGLGHVAGWVLWGMYLAMRGYQACQRVVHRRQTGDGGDPPV